MKWCAGHGRRRRRRWAGIVPVAREQEDSQVSRYHAGVGGNGELVRAEGAGPILGSGPVRKAVAKIAFQPQIVQVIERAAEHGPLLDRVAQAPGAQHARQPLGRNRTPVAADALQRAAARPSPRPNESRFPRNRTSFSSSSVSSPARIESMSAVRSIIRHVARRYIVPRRAQPVSGHHIHWLGRGRSSGSDDRRFRSR